MARMNEDTWESKRVEGSVSIDEFQLDYANEILDGPTILAVNQLFKASPRVRGVLLSDDYGMVYEITRD